MDRPNKQPWWQRFAQQSSAAPFELECDCGVHVKGRRKTAFQIVACPGCRAELFVLPQPSWLSPPPQAAVAPQPLWTRGIALRGILTLSALVAVVLAAWLILSYLSTETQPLVHRTSVAGFKASARARLEARLADARDHLQRGHFALARTVLDEVAAQQPLAQEPCAFEQLRREVALLADLSGVSLEKMVEHAAELPEEEWQLVFAQRYYGMGVLLDDELARQDGASWRFVNHQFQQRQQPIHLDLEDLQVLRLLPENAPQRVLLGVRVRSIGRTVAGWTVRFQPESGVLLTEAQALSWNCPDASIAALCLRQKLLLEKAFLERAAHREK